MDDATGRMLLRLSREAVHNYLRIRPGARWDADTMRGDALDGAIEAYDRFDPTRGALVPWCYGRAYGSILDGVRRRSVVGQYALRAEPDLDKHPASHQPLHICDMREVVIPSPRDPYAQVDQRDLLRRLLAKANLTPRAMEVLVRCVMYEQTTQAAIARRDGVTESAVAQRRLHALQKIRRAGHLAGEKSGPQVDI